MHVKNLKMMMRVSVLVAMLLCDAGVASATLPPTTAAKCEEVRADIVFVIDTTTPTKTSLKLAGCNPINPIRALASRMVREIESVISEDEVRVAAITFGKCAN